MRSFMERMRWKFENFMIGRYGQDELNIFLTRAALVCWILSIFIFRGVFSFLFWFCLIWSMFRMFSKNSYKRNSELLAYQKLSKKPKQFFSRQKSKWRDRKTHRYFKCKCGAFLRVPKGKGKINITCRVCKAQMIRKT